MLKRIEMCFTVRRIRRMERIFDDLCSVQPDVIQKSAVLKRKLRILTRYYESKNWRRDYERDERGELPADLKRGVLSEDGVFNLLSGIKEH